MTLQGAARRRYRLNRRRADGVGPTAVTDRELGLRPLVRLAGFESLTALLRHLSAQNGRSHRADGLTIWQADRAAVACGFHPSDVWGAAWWRAVARHELRYAGDLAALVGDDVDPPTWLLTVQVEQLEHDVDELADLVDELDAEP